MPFYKPSLPELTFGQANEENRRSPTPDPAVFRWHGLVVARAWPADMDEDEMLLMRVNGLRWRVEHAREFGGAIQLDERNAREGRRTLDRNALDTREFKNVACNAGRGNILNFVASSSGTINNSATGIVAFAVGTTAGSPASGDAQLFNETYRKAITLTTISGNQIDLTTNFGSADGNYSYQDCGIFGSALAGTSGAASGGAVASTTTINTGMLFAHANYVYNKTSSISLSNDYYITLS